MTSLLDGPRGRRLCLELITDASDEVATGLGDLARVADEAAGASTGRVTFAMIGDLPTRSGPRRQPVSMDVLADLIAAVCVDPTTAAIDAAFARSVDVARYWQEPDGADLVAADQRIAGALGHVARAVSEHAATQWWMRERAPEQWAIEFDPTDDGAPFDPAPDGASRWSAATRDEEDRARRERPADVTARFGGHWWSHPWGAPHTTGERADGVPAGIPYVEDGFGWRRAVAIPVGGAGRTYEIRGADAWADLCRRYPLEVTYARRHEWYRVTGRDGRWLLPDWERVAGDWDAVHLTAAAYLTAATREIVVDDEYSSLIGGWGPDETYWLTGRVRETERPRVHWRADDRYVDTRWEPVG
ncbi:MULTISPECIES: hypothetical protein [unclassified Microbacterium]|uniref:hypothetical protein n=1 Tax=unclassified Microbacterium TaxID=2609290 RepID=UPI0030177B4D